MMGRHLTGLILLTALMTGTVNAADSQPQSRRATICAKLDHPQQRANLTPQQRQQLRECRAQKSVPWVVDPTPIFIL